jgi:hypothetical protein
MAFIDRNFEITWVRDNILNGINRSPLQVGLKYISNEITDEVNGFVGNYKQNKNYQFITTLKGNINQSVSIKLSSPFKSSLICETKTIVGTNSYIDFYTYANTLTNEYSKNLIKYGAHETFTDCVITNSKLNEIDFLLNGYREFKYNNLTDSDISQPNGWCYNSPNTYKWNYSTASNISPTYSTFGSGQDITILPVNYIAKIIDYDVFNIEFSYNHLGDTTSGINMYLVEQNKLKDGISNWGATFATLNSTQNYKKIDLKATNLDGTKNYLVFSATYSYYDFYGEISDINIYGGYNDKNNTQVTPYISSSLLDVSSTIDNASYGFDVVLNNATYSLSSKIGNGMFQSGIWENGVWNNGWRDDTESKDFDDIQSSVLYSYDISWKIKISGSTFSCNSFNIGDKVAIGNIVAIDINDNRKLIRDYYRITDKDVNNFWIEVSLDTTFPYRRIEKDSPNHKIKVTKNVWLSGAFFNGYFSGVWNNGLFKGYPKITEMFNTHWIDGFFNGGHFNSNYPVYKFTNILRAENCEITNITLVFAFGHDLIPGDYIVIVKTGSNSSKNTSYNGIAKVISIYNNTVTVDKNYGVELKNEFGVHLNETGEVTRYTASSLIQNFKFYDTNRSKLKSSESLISSGIFSFNSWIDTNYDNTRSVTLGRNFKSYEPITGKSVNKNNLYGYPTYDVLSSSSRFRNSYDLEYGLYKLGTKYKIFTDFIGDGSEFNEPFNDIDYSPLYDKGWTYSTITSSNVNIKRTENIISLNDSESIKYTDFGVTGKEIWLSATSSGVILNNNNISINGSRYSVVELDVITHSVTNYDYLYDNPDNYIIKSIDNTDSFTEMYPSSTEIVATHSIVNTLGVVDVYDIVVNVSLFGPVNTTILNLVAPNGKIINLKKRNFGYGGRMVNTKFSLKEKYIKFSDITTPYNLNNNFAYSDTYLIDNEIGQGEIPHIADTTTLGDLTTNIYGIWTLYVKYDNSGTVDLSNWSISIKYKELVSINNEPTSTFPVLNFSNLNYDSNSQILDDEIQQIYKKMSYLPISTNVNHLLTTNTFRFDSIEKTSPIRYNGFGKNTKNKKYEYFYNKTDLMLGFRGNGATGGSQSMVVLDNIKMYEVDMIPFFKYFNDSNIYKGIQTPFVGMAPNIDYLNSDFIFIDNITIGLDSINNTIINNTIKCIPPSIQIFSDSITVITSLVTSITETSAIGGGTITIVGNIQIANRGICWDTIPTPDTTNAIINNGLNNVYSDTMTGLMDNTTYYYRAYVIVGTTITYGNTISFTTVATPPDYLVGDYSSDYKI